MREQTGNYGNKLGRPLSCKFSGLYGETQWPRGLRHELSSLARPLGSWVRIPLRAWMFGLCMRLFCVFVVLCLDSGLATG
jgi:hypothetical protein